MAICNLWLQASLPARRREKKPTGLMSAIDALHGGDFGLQVAAQEGRIHLEQVRVALAQVSEEQLHRQIVELAKKNEVPLREDSSLAESLAKVPVGVEIPAELWGAMAEILAQIYLLDRQQRA